MLNLKDRRIKKMAHYYLSCDVSYLFEGEIETEVETAIVEAKSLAEAKKEQRKDILTEYGADAKIHWDDAYRTSDDARL